MRRFDMKTIICFFIMVSSLIFIDCGEKLTTDQKAVKKVLTDYTNALKKGNFAAAYNYISSISREYISLAEFANTWTKNLTAEGIGRFKVENVAIVEMQSKIYATAIINREWFSHADNKKGTFRIDYHLIRENGYWRILRTNEIDNKIKTLWNKGEKKRAKELAELCMKIDPFTATSAEQYIAQLFETKSQPTTTSTDVVSKSSISSKDIKFTIRNKGYDGSSFFIEYSITNNSQSPIKRLKAKAVWREPDVEEILAERTDYLVFYGDIPLEKGYSKTGKLTYWASKEISKVKADLYLSINDSDWQLIEHGVLVSIPSIAKDIRFEIIKTSYQQSMASDLTSYIYVGRIDFRITNISGNTIDRLIVKVVWFERTSGEILDEDATYVIGYGDTPLSPGTSKSDYITSGKGLKGRYPDLVADIYVARYDDKYELLRKGVRIE